MVFSEFLIRKNVKKEENLINLNLSSLNKRREI